LLYVFRAAESAGVCQVVLRSNATLGQIVNIFQRPDLEGRIAVLHLAGIEQSHHDPFARSARPLALAGRELGAYLAAQQGLHLVYLSGRSTHQLGATLMDTGVPAIMSVVPGEEAEDEWPSLWCAE
jgi:hypothetical protein